MAWCTSQGWSREEAGARCCLAGPICLTRSGCFDTTSGFPSLNWHAANGCIPFSTHSTTRSSAQHTSLFRSPVCFRSLRAGRFTSPCSSHWLAAFFGGYNAARVWHFWLMWVYILFVVPHVILVFADGWDTLRSMIVGWSTRAERSEVVANEQCGKGRHTLDRYGTGSEICFRAKAATLLWRATSSGN